MVLGLGAAEDAGFERFFDAGRDAEDIVFFPLGVVVL